MVGGLFVLFLEGLLRSWVDNLLGLTPRSLVGRGDTGSELDVLDTRFVLPITILSFKTSPNHVSLSSIMSIFFGETPFVTGIHPSMSLEETFLFQSSYLYG